MRHNEVRDITATLLTEVCQEVMTEPHLQPLSGEFLSHRSANTQDGASGVAKLGHTGAHALATGGCAPPVQALLKIIGAECTVINHQLGLKVHKGVEIELRSIAICIFRITRSCVVS